jgi:hypothetical protein
MVEANSGILTGDREIWKQIDPSEALITTK